MPREQVFMMDKFWPDKNEGQ